MIRSTHSILTLTLLAGGLASTALACSSPPGSSSTSEPGDNAAVVNEIAAPQPQQVAPPGARQIALSYKDTCAVLANGAVACWGRNTSGQLGSGEASTSANPLPRIVPAVVGARSVATGTAQTCAVLTSGAATCWGDDFFGELGNATRTNALTPEGVVGMSDVTNLVTSEGFSCAIETGGAVSCWGTDSFGELGDNGAVPLSASAVPVPGVSGVTAIAAGENHLCALLSSGGVTCWGANDSGQLGNATGAGQSAPVTVNGITDAIGVAAGLVHSCALRVDGAVFCWGYDGSGALGDGRESGTARTTPVRVRGIEDAVEISAGGYETCALRSCGEVACWGANDAGQIGDGSTANATTPVRVEGISTAVQVAVGDGHACARLGNGEVMCWGANDLGQLGDGTTVSRALPAPVIGLPQGSGS